MSATCGNCRHWHEDRDGMCSGGPPTAGGHRQVLPLSVDKPPLLLARAVWPCTLEDDTCGTWSPRVPPPDPAPPEPDE